MKSRSVVLAVLLCVFAIPNLLQSQAKPAPADSTLAKLAGSWILSTDTWGLGFGAGTIPGDKTPPTVISRQGNAITLKARVQTDQGQFGQPVFDDFAITLKRSGAADYLLTVDSASWLKLKDLPLTRTTDKELKGETTLPFQDKPLPVTVVIQLSDDGGHKWDFTQNQSDGKLFRSFGLKFKRPATTG